MARRSGLMRRLRGAVAALRREVKVYRLVLRDPRTPRRAKVILAVAVGYALSPIDLIPDFIPVIGYLDDLLIVPLLLWLAVRMIPRQVMDDCRRRAALDEIAKDG